jgi:predicted transcriptional regulator of viral defense system
LWCAISFFAFPGFVGYTLIDRLDRPEFEGGTWTLKKANLRENESRGFLFL